MTTISLRLVILPKGVYYRETQKYVKKMMPGSTDVLFVVYIRPSHLTNTALIFQEFTTMSEITHMKKLIEDQYVLRRYFKVRPEVNDEIKTSISYIKYELKIYIENNIIGKTIREKSFWLHGDGLKNCSL